MSENDEKSMTESPELEVQESEAATSEAAGEVEGNVASGEAEGDGASKPKKKMKLAPKILIVVGIVIVVLGGGVGGFYLGFHNQPWFCNFICHTPMDPYVVSYEDGTSVNAAQADFKGQLSVTTHKESDQHLDCLTCHVPSMGEQISEGMKWVSGNYTLPLEMKLISGQPKEDSGSKNGEEFCLRADCHEGIATLDDLKKATANQTRNPHDSHLGKQDCSNCHQTHEQSVMMCTNCHADAKVPDGWLTYKQQQDQKKQLAAG
ncbi:MAG: cytochrome c3 family protein [Coriobacteriales bacterium]|jgi:hypothetical protein|nr:cytochrome c3 family protein [Coriobacteriales bacterium]